MTPKMKDVVRGFVQASGYQLVRLPPDRVSGVNLAHDLAAIVRRPDPLCLDIGANDGQTIRLLQRTFRAPKIHAFEPSPDAFARLEAHKFTGTVWLHGVAMGARCETRELATYADTDLSSFLMLDRPEANGFRGTTVVRRDRVQVTTVDRFVIEQQISGIDLLKIDTQGFDLEVLKGSTCALSQTRCVLVELNFVPMYQDQGAAAEIVTVLEDAGFRLVDYYDKARRQRALAWCTAMFAREQ